MIEYENECVSCEPYMGCLGSQCPHRHVPHFYCDECKEEFDPDELYVIDGRWYCEDCLKEILQRVSDLDEDDY